MHTHGGRGFAIMKFAAKIILYGLRDAIHHLSPWAGFSLSPLGGRGKGEGVPVVYPMHSSVCLLCGLSALALVLTACKKQPPPSPERYAAAKTNFFKIARDYHTLSAEKTGNEKTELLRQAAAGYEALLKEYPEQHHWCAQALRSLASVKAAQGQTNAAIRLYAQVGEKYSEQDWEVIQAWKAAGDLLRESGRREEAQAFYRRIVERFDKPDATQVVKIIVKGAKAALAPAAAP